LGSAALLALLPVCLGMPAQAQTAPAATTTTTDTATTTTAPDPRAEQVVVTGSSIRHTDAASANPITVITAADIAKTSAITVEDILRKNPAADFTGGISSSNDTEGGAGASEVSLRNLGPQRTLVLVNGLRYPSTDTEITQVAVDIGNIPVSMIDHIDILRDGASSIYGADAIGGVINVITKQHYSGVEVGGTVGESSYGDGLKYGVYSTLGSDFDRGNIIINASTDHQDALPSSDRLWSNDQHLGTAFANNYTSSRPSGTVALIKNGTKTTNYFFYDQNSNYHLANDPSFWAANSSLLPTGDLFAGTGIHYNYEPTELLNASSDNRKVNFSGHYDVLPNVTATLEAFFTERTSQENQNPQPVGYNIQTNKFPNGLIVPAYLENGTDANGNILYQLNASGQKILNPYNPTTTGNSIVANPAAAFGAGAVNTDVPILTRRFENGARFWDQDAQTYRIRGGLEGTLWSDYDWNVNYAYGQSTVTNQLQGAIDYYHLAQEAGQVACGADVAIGCSVANLMGYNTLTPAQAKYLTYNNTRTSELTLGDVTGGISGPVPGIMLPAGPLRGAIGFEYRTDSTSDNPSAVQVQGDADSDAQPTQGNYATSSGFAELNAPLISNLPFVKMLTIDASSRYDYNTTFGRALTYKFGFDYAVNDDIRFRGGRSTGFRAPQVKELYGGNYVLNPTGSDPCASGPYVNSTACVTQIKLADPSYTPGTTTLTQVNQLYSINGGNPNLKPETSQEWTLGTVITPHWVKNLTFTADFYQVLIRNLISSYDTNAILAYCYGGSAAPVYAITQAQCFRSASNPTGLIGPRTSTGAIGSVYTLNTNIGTQNSSGIDLGTNYSFNTEDVSLPAWGRIDLTGSAEYLLRDTLSLPGGTKLQQAGTFNSASATGGTGLPRWKALVGTTFTHDAMGFSLSERYYGGLKNIDETSYLTNCTKGCGDYPGNEVAGVFYTDVSFSYAYDKLKFTVGVDNLFDKDPPWIGPSTVGSITDAGYDFMGRFVYLKTSVHF
jgi:iron complex outermembrane recepter protein